MSAPHPAPKPRTARITGLAVATAVIALATLGLAGCGNDPAVVTVTAPGDATPSSTPTGATATPEPTDAPVASAGPQDDPPGPSAPFYANTLPDTETASAGAFLSPVNLRFGVHEGYDRIVIDLEGTGTPGWRAEYVASPTGGASGEPVLLAGGAYLRIEVTGVTYPTEPGAHPYVGPVNFSPATGGVVRQVKVGAVFEGTVEVFVGVASEQPFRVFAREDPARVVIDVQHP